MGTSAGLSSSIALAVALWLPGCAALRGDGYYGCMRGGCPPSAPICGADGLCHLTGATLDGSVDAPAIDASPADSGAAPLSYPPCNGDVAGACDPDSCYSDPVLAATNDGYCTRSCVVDADCPAFRGASSACIRGQCLRGCNDATDCTDVLACASGRWVDGAALRLCSSLVAAEANWYEVCEIDSDCQRPLSCVNGVCLRACGNALDCVPGLETCITSAVTGTRGCLYLCSTGGDCGTLGGPCEGGGCHPSAAW